MNKKLLSLAVGAALGATPLFAQADVVVYGQLNAEIASEDTDSGFAGSLSRSGSGNAIDALNRSDDSASTVDGTTMEDNKRGRLGIKASEKLANGLTAIAKFEWQVDTTDADSNDGDRESLVGLKGGFGEVQFGSLKAAYKYTGGVKYDPFVTTNLEARRYGGMLNGRFGQNSFLRNSIGYITPNMGGLKGWVTYSPDDGSSDNGRGTDQGDWSASLAYSAGNWEVFIAGTQDNGDGEDSINGRSGAVTTNGIAASTGDFTAYKIGGKFKFGNHTFLGQYEQAEDDANVANVDTIDMFFLGYHLQMGNNTFVAQYGDSTVEHVGGLNDQEGQYYALGLVHKMSKKTRVYGGYRKTEVDNVGGGTSNAEGDVVSLGLRVDF